MRFVPRPLRLCLCAASFTGGVLLSGLFAHAENLRIGLRAEGTCPTAEALALEVRALAPGVTLDPGSTSAPTYLVRDAGRTVTLRGASVDRTLLDAARRCAHRARTLAFILVVTLQPPRVDVPAPKRADTSQPAAPPRPPAAATPPPKAATPAPPRTPTAEAPRASAPSRAVTAPASPGRTSHVALELSAGFEAGPGAPAGSDVFAFAGTLRVLAGWRYFAATFAVSGLSPTTLELAGVRARITSLPMELGARLRLPLGRGRAIALGLEVGVEARVLFAHGQGLAPSRSGVTSIWGVRFAPVVEVPVGLRWSLVASAPLHFFPSPLELTSAALRLGAGPRLLLGFGLGVGYRFGDGGRR